MKVKIVDKVLTFIYRNLYNKGMSIELLTCLRCGHQWYPRTPKLPAHCSKCKSPYWDKPRGQKRGRKVLK